MTVKTVAKIAGGLVVLVVAALVGVFAYLANLDYNEQKPRIIAEVKKATGRDLEIAGDLSLDIGLSPGIVANGLRFQNAAWSADKNMVDVDRFEAKVNLLPLLSGTVEVERLILSKARILIERNDKGAFNFEFTPPAKAGAAEAAPATTPETAASGGGSMALPVIQLIEIQEAQFIYRDALTGQSKDAQIERLILAGEGVSDPLDLDFKGSVDGLAIGFGGKLGAPAEMLNPSRPWPIDLGGEVAGAVWALKGTIAEPTAARGLDLTFTAQGNQLGDLSQAAAIAAPGAAVPALGPYKLAATLTGSADGVMKLAGIDASIGSPAIVQATVKGGIADLVKVAGLDLAISLNGENLANASAAAGSELPPIGPISLAATAKGSLAQQISMEGFTGKIGGSDLAGTVRISTAGGKPYVGADLRSTLFDLADVAPPAKEGQGASSSAAASSAGQAAAPSDGRAIPATPLPVDGLRAADADVKLAVATFKGPSGLSVQDIQITLALKNGDLKVTPISAKLGDGSIAGSFRLNASGAVPALNTDLEVKKLDLNKLLAEMGTTDLIYGTVNTKLDLAGQGGDLRTLLGSLTGKSDILMGEGRIKSEALDVWIGGATAMLSKLVSGNKPEYTVVNCFVNTVDFKNGLGNITAGVFDIEYATISLAGDVNLKTEGLNLTIDPQPKSATINTAVPVKIGGTFLKPSYALDPLATARKAAGLLGAVAFPPAALLGLGEMGSGDSNPCLQQGKSGSSGQTQQQAPAQSSNPVESVGKGVGGALKGIFGGGN